MIETFTAALLTKSFIIRCFSVARYIIARMIITIIISTLRRKKGARAAREPRTLANSVITSFCAKKRAFDNCAAFLVYCSIY